MNSIDFTLGVFLTKAEYDLLDWMCNCDSHGNPFKRNEDVFPCPYSPLDHIATAEIALRRYLRDGNIDMSYYKNLFEDNPFGYNKIDVIKLVNRCIFKVFYNLPLYLGVINHDREYRISNGLVDDVDKMVAIRFANKDSYYTNIVGQVGYNDRIQEIFDIKWGGLLLRNVEYDDMIVYGIGNPFNPSESGEPKNRSLVQKMSAYREGRIAESAIVWKRVMPGGILENANEAGIVGGAVFNAVVAGNQQAILGGNLEVDDDDFFADMGDVREVEIAGGDMPF